VRLADEHAVCELLGVDPFTEDELYQALDWLCEQQDTIEKKLFRKTFGGQAPTLFLYDVTSSYLEGDQNELGDWGYNRDKKRGKKQIVIGLLCSDDGTPVSVRVFKDREDRPGIRLSTGDHGRRPGHDQERSDRGIERSRVPLHYRDHQTADPCHVKQRRIAVGLV